MYSTVIEFVAGGSASCLAEIVTLPFDTVKVRAQLEGCNSILPVLKDVVIHEGVASLFAGLDAALLRQAFYGSMRYGLYPPIQALFTTPFGRFIVFLIGGTEFSRKLLSGCIAGAIASGICNPTDLVKVRMQGSLQRRITKKDVDIPYDYKNALDAFAQILSKEGFLAMWTGVGPTMLRASVLAAVEMSVYDTLKSQLSRYNTMRSPAAVHVISALFASIFSAFFSCPFDMARSRVMNQPKNKNGEGLLYKSAIHCLVVSVKQDGISVLLAGYGAFLMRLVPNTILTFFFLEQIRSFLLRN